MNLAPGWGLPALRPVSFADASTYNDMFIHQEVLRDIMPVTMVHAEARGQRGTSVSPLAERKQEWKRGCCTDCIYLHIALPCDFETLTCLWFASTYSEDRRGEAPFWGPTGSS